MAQVVAHHSQLKRYQTEVVTISFGSEYWANVWLSETQSPFPLLLDQERIGYKTFGLSSSWIHSWGINNLTYYAKALWRGEQLKPNRGDLHQLGGDFIVNHKGICQFINRSKDPTDRPEMITILNMLERLNSNEVR